MESDLTHKQKINAELMARGGNKVSAKKLRQYIPVQEQDGLKIDFNCECADPTCKARIPLTLDEYGQLHNKRSRFVVVKGHVEPDIEKVAKTGQGLQVVEKYALSDS
jgi:hypothetical protein